MWPQVSAAMPAGHSSYARWITAGYPICLQDVHLKLPADYMPYI